MENVNENQVDSPNDAGSTEGKQDVVAYESFRKSVDAEKRAREKAQELERQLEQIKHGELEKQGKHEEIIETLKKKNYELESNLKKERETYLWNNVTSAVKTEALKHNCLDPDGLVKLLDKNDFQLLQAENGQIRSESLSALMDKAKKERNYLFNKGEVRMNDATPSGSGKDLKVDTSKMSVDELESFIKKQFS